MTPADRRAMVLRFWLRIYALCFVVYLLAAIGVFAWLVVGAARGSNGVGDALLWLAFCVPLGFAVVLPVSIPVALLWGGLALVLGGSLEPPLQGRASVVRAVCGGCGYNLEGLADPDRCPECGALLHPPAD